MMPSIRNLKIGYRLALCISLILILMLGVSFIAVTGAKTPRRQLATLIADSNTRLTTVADMRQHLLQQEVMARRLSTVTSFESAKQIMVEMTEKHDAYARMMRDFTRIQAFEDERAVVAQVIVQLENVKPGLDAAAESVAAFNPRRAAEILNKSVSPAHVESLQALDDVVQIHTQRIRDRVEALDSAARRADIAIAIISTVAVALAAMIAFLLTRSITRPLKDAVTFADALGNGRLDARRPDAPGDETGLLINMLGDMAGRLLDARQRLERLSTEDALTGAYNRRYFDQALRTELQRATRLCRDNDLVPSTAQLSLLLLDVDHFKKYNDKFGHPAGDACLQAIVTAIRSASLRPADVVARYGGEEFAVILPNSDMAGAAAVAERVRASVVQAGLESAAPDNPVVTVSIGAAVAVDPRIVSAEQLIQVADDALYRAKRQGRNRVCLESCLAPAEPALAG